MNFLHLILCSIVELVQQQMVYLILLMCTNVATSASLGKVMKIQTVDVYFSVIKSLRRMLVFGEIQPKTI